MTCSTDDPISLRTHAVSESEALRQQVARYDVYVSRGYPRKRVIVAHSLTLTDAQAESEEIGKRLRAKRPDEASSMHRSLAGFEMSNAEEVRRIMGYGIDFDVDRARARIDALRAAGQLPPTMSRPTQAIAA